MGENVEPQLAGQRPNAALRGPGSFELQLGRGQAAETRIARWLRSRGNVVLPVYDTADTVRKGPRVFAPDREYIAPDLLCFKTQLEGSARPIWIEAKHKSVFSWRGLAGQWEDGIDLRCWKDYLALRSTLSHPIWLLFLHESDVPWMGDRSRWATCPATCPTGLYGNELRALADPAPRFDARHARGMVYWPIQRLILLAPIDAVP